MKEYLIEAVKPFEFELSKAQIEQFETYYGLLLEWNEKINLTRITEPQEVAVKHFADSLSVLSFCDIPKGAKVIDIGTGAGFPGIPLKIARPDIKLTLLDSLNKRLNFLGEVCKSVGIDAQLVHMRAEEGGRDKKYREKFDIAISRAVARMNTLAEYCIPFVKVEGAFIAMKGPDAEEEIRESERAVEILGGCVEDFVEFELTDGSQRTIVVVRKEEHTQKIYPRQGKQIKHKGL